jgi:dipeptidase
MSIATQAYRPRVSCDSLVALPGATASGNVLYAKNSDRPARECQPLALIPAARHAPGAGLRCQYIEIPQVERTLRVLGSRPFWLWGLEHGVNEAGVAAGNHTVFTRDKPEGRKLIGMDLVRLGLERGATARHAVDVICELVERYGQGGSGYHDADFPYHSSFLVADRVEAYLVETSDRHWASRRIDAVGSATNHVTIGTDWDALSSGAIAHAEDAGWWSGGAERFDFAAAYRDVSWVPPTFSSGRYRRTCEILAAARGEISEATLRRALRDHYDGPVHAGIYPPDDERYLSVCMHADPIGSTTAGAVVEIPAEPSRPIRFAACLGAPCVGVFIPLYVAGDLPAVLSRGGLDATADSPWWGFRRLLEAVERDPQRLAPLVRREWDRDEQQMMVAALRLEERVAESGPAGEFALTEFSAQCTAQVLDRLEEIGAMAGA